MSPHSSPRRAQRGLPLSSAPYLLGRKLPIQTNSQLLTFPISHNQPLTQPHILPRPDLAHTQTPRAGGHRSSVTNPFLSHHVWPDFVEGSISKPVWAALRESLGDESSQVLYLGCLPSVQLGGTELSPEQPSPKKPCHAHKAGH